MAAPPEMLHLCRIRTLTPRERDVLMELIDVYPGGLDGDRLWARCTQFDFDPPGIKSLHVHLTHLRHKLAGTGWTIPRNARGGAERYRLALEAEG